MSKKNKFLAFSFHFLILSVYCPSIFAVCEVEPALESCGQGLSYKSLIEVNSTKRPPAYEGLTAQGIDALKEIRDAVRFRFRLFDSEFKSLRTVHHLATIARISKGNMFLYGPPGGAKSALVEWILHAEKESTFQLQLHQMLTEQVFVGGQNFDKARLGEFVINTKGSLADYKVALLDELEKGNPAALASLLSLLNERKILAGNQVIETDLETVFVTSNANLREFFEQFIESGQRSTAAALLNRFQFKTYIYNWLSKKDQSFLDKRRALKRYLKTLELAGVDVSSYETFLTPPILDWDKARFFANLLMKPNELFMSSYLELADDMRSETNKAIIESELKNKISRFDEPFIYFPSCDLTERIRQQIPEIILYSAFVDFLLSDLANDENLPYIASKPMELGPLSLWRAYLVMTTIGPGEAKLKVSAESAENEKVEIGIDFGVKLEESSARDHKEVYLMRNLEKEQNRFLQVFRNKMELLQQTIKEAVMYGNKNNPKNQGDFELQVIGE